jgi:hypothetical protein
MNKLTPEVIGLMTKVLHYSDRYEITVQFWPEYKTAYIAKDGVDLYSYGSYDTAETLSDIINYLDRINKS